MKWTSKYREVKTRGRKGQEVGGVTPRKRVTLLFFFWGGGGEILERAEGKKKTRSLSLSSFHFAIEKEKDKKQITSRPPTSSSHAQQFAHNSAA